MPVLEIGAGLGDLTAALLQRRERVVAIERDRDLVPLLQERFAQHPRFEVIETNALTYAIPMAEAPWLVVGNLPYHISSRILFHLLAQRQAWSRAVLMFQKEVAQRVAATDPKSPHWSGLSARVSRLCTVQWVGEVGPGCFHPPPKVDSAVIALSPRPQSDELADADFSRMVRVVFAERRKTLRNNLKKGVARPIEQIDAVLEQLGIDPRIRGERLGVEQLRELTKALILT